MQTQSKSIKVIVAQTKPIYKIIISLSKYRVQDQIDIIILPEMALTGYIFKDKEDIKPFLDKVDGITFQLCREISQRLNCYTLCGYAEIDGDLYYNSAILVDRKGNFVINHRKKHLFESDKTWATEGSNFTSTIIRNTKNKDIKVAIGICMDINCYEFIDNSQFEFASFCKQQEVDVVILISAWNDHEPENNKDSADEGIMNYWLWRLSPLVNKKGNEEPYSKSWVFICADRVGQEEYLNKPGSTTYIGCSCIIKVNPMELVQYLKKKDEGYMICELNI